MVAGWWAQSRALKDRRSRQRRKPPCSPACWRLAHSPPQTRQAIPEPKRWKRPWASTATTCSISTTWKPERPDVDETGGHLIWQRIGLFGRRLDRYAVDLSRFAEAGPRM